MAKKPDEMKLEIEFVMPLDTLADHVASLSNDAIAEFLSQLAGALSRSAGVEKDNGNLTAASSLSDCSDKIDEAACIFDGAVVWVPKD